MASQTFNLLDDGCFTGGDPLTTWLKGRWHTSPWLGTVICSALINFPLIIIASVNNLWFNRNGLVGLLNDYGWWAIQLSMTPATFFFFFWAPDGICRMLQGLVANRVILLPATDDQASLQNFVHRFDRSYSHWIWLALSVLVAIGFVSLIVPIHRTFRNLVALDEVAFWYTEFFWFIMTILVALLVGRGVIVIVWLQRFFREFQVTVRPLHKDGAGGLAPLGDFSAKIGYLIGIYGIAIVAIFLTQSYWITGEFGNLVMTTQMIVTLAAYLILSPFAFFAPISTAHAAMLQARNNLICQIDEQLEFDLAQVRSALTVEANKLKATLDKVEQLQRLHALALRFPVWPFNAENFVHFFSSILSPIVFALVPSIVNLLVKLLD